MGSFQLRKVEKDIELQTRSRIRNNHCRGCRLLIVAEEGVPVDEK
jgi:hypothetical protein